jgi:hypothetical protein
MSINAKSDMMTLIIFFIYKYPMISFFIYYACCLFYNADENKPPIDMTFNVRKLLNFSMVVFLCDLIVIIFVTLITVIIPTGEKTEETKALVSFFSEYRSILGGFGAFYENIISSFIFLPFSSLFFCLIFMNFNIRNSFIWTYDATICKNFNFIIFAFVLAFIYSITTNIIPLLSYSLLFIGPYILCVIYVIIKHIFFNMTPVHKTLKSTEKTLNYKTQTSF